MSLIKKYSLILLGFISLGLGVLGIFLPLLPTTPFLLLSSYCFLRSSEKLYNWLVNHKIFGKYINNYLKYRAVTRTTKISSILVLWLSLAISMLLIKNIYIIILLFIIGIGVSWHILSLKTFNKNDMPTYEKTEEKIDY